MGRQVHPGKENARFTPSHRPGRPSPEDQPSLPGRRPSTVGPGSHRLTLNLNLAETPPKTNLNLPQEKPGAAPPRLRLRLRTRRRHPGARPLCDRLLTTHRPALLAPRHRTRQTQQRPPAGDRLRSVQEAIARPSTSTSQRPRQRPTSTFPRKSQAPEQPTLKVYPNSTPRPASRSPKRRLVARD